MGALNQLYRHFDKDGDLLYVGISLSAIDRSKQHKNGSDWWQEVASITVENFASRAAAERAERRAISSERPIHNRMHADQFPVPIPDWADRSTIGRNGRVTLAARFRDTMGQTFVVAFGKAGQFLIQPRRNLSIGVDSDIVKQFQHRSREADQWYAEWFPEKVPPTDDFEI
ncbi:hypothetical protein [Maritimibacter sp. UBA3975]|uniref:hypothetical protein n=1 Tax=Maritimibacter sp. UBA3975 TaxID=1946833 RepID=UPI000C0AFEA8|nr:hypothetical protein [Maritimibacter sp. UBA3975]MAM60881.1 hypothetical protein [Maritimibacter sp.]|tara:strand:- start:27864 stop:28376 length:513 start_codon:yes stop_codon:yes gene_type:complete